MAGALKKIRFWIYYWPRTFWQLPFPAILLPLSRRSALGRYRGITICSDSFSQTPGKEFLDRTLQALQLVERVDARRFKRIQAHLRFIVHTELASGACYRHLGRVCNVDFSRHDFARGQDWYPYCYAAALVHEATHGLIYSRYVPDMPRNRLRIEKLCHAEERRFIRRLDTPDRYWSEQIPGEFDEKYFAQYYTANFFSRARAVRARIAEVRKQRAAL